MTAANTPMPGEDPGSLPDDQRENERDPASDAEIEVVPQFEADSSLPPVEDDPEVQKSTPEPT